MGRCNGILSYFFRENVEGERGGRRFSPEHKAFTLNKTWCLSLVYNSNGTFIQVFVLFSIGSVRRCKVIEFFFGKIYNFFFITFVYENLLNSANQVDRARVLAASSSHTEAWLNTTPVSSMGLYLNDSSVRVAVALRLWIMYESYIQCKRFIFVKQK